MHYEPVVSRSTYEAVIVGFVVVPAAITWGVTIWQIVRRQYLSRKQ